MTSIAPRARRPRSSSRISKFSTVSKPTQNSETRPMQCFRKVLDGAKPDAVDVHHYDHTMLIAQHTSVVFATSPKTSIVIAAGG